MSSKPPLSRYVLVDASPAALARIWSGVSARLEALPQRGRRFFGARAFAGAVLVAAATAGVFVYVGREAPRSAWQHAALETASDTLVVDLDDGSRLELDAHTRLEVVEGSEKAVSVELTRGRVECDMVPKPDRHFAVRAAGVEVRVTGTRFSVEVAPGKAGVTVAVERGSVQVQPPGGSAPRRLSAGERWSIDLSRPQPTEETAQAPSAPLDARQADDVAPARSSARPNRADAEPRASADAEAESPALETQGPRELFDLGNAARRNGDSRAAARAYELLLGKYPSDGRAGLAAFELGRLRMSRLGDTAGAIQAFRRAIALAPGAGFREDAMARLVEAYESAGQIGQCRSARAAYLRDYPNGVHHNAVRQQCGGDAELPER